MGPMLYMLGLVVIDVAPFNAEAVTRETAADFARKEIIGAMTPREAVGEGDEVITLTGNLFPQRMSVWINESGLDQLAALNVARISQAPQLLVRGDLTNMGWFLIEHMVEKHIKLDGHGIGKNVAYEIRLIRSPQAATPAAILTNLIGLFG